jgi:Glycosyl transferase family group 2
MLINFIKKGIYGYLREDRVGIYSFISNNNLSLRRQAIVEAGGYDDALRIAEDYDVCQRLGRAGWLLYFCPEVSGDHRARKKFRGLLKQWWNYGLHLAPGFRRYYPGRAIVSLAIPAWQDDDNPEPIRRALPVRYGRLRQLVSVFVHVSPFVMVHAAGAALLIAIVYGNQSITWTMAMVFAALLLGYARPDFKNRRRDGWRKALGLFVIRFAVNSAFVWGGLLGGIKCGALCIFPPIHTRVVAGESPTGLERIQKESAATVVKAVELSS